MNKKLKSVLFSYWGHSTFRPLQEEIINDILLDKNLLVLLPTGGGKSICFQIPALIKDGLCLVISPLISLMQDQVMQLKKRGISALALHSGMSYKEIDIALERAVYGRLKFLYIAPERLGNPTFLARLGKMKINLIVVDEAHCIVDWGHDFRPAYLKIVKICEKLIGVNIVALTATATPKSRKEIIERLNMSAPRIYKKSFVRPNLAYIVNRCEDKFEFLKNTLTSIQGSSIVYVSKRQEAEDLALYIIHQGISATYYHAGLTIEQRVKNQKAWTNGVNRIIVATNAFGMGIDKPNVRLVLHLYIPSSLEAYYQEAGRAGRDEKKAYAILCYQSHQIKELEKNSLFEIPDLSFIKQVYQHVANYCQVAVGSFDKKKYPFDLYKFSLLFKLSSEKVKKALKWLVSQQLIKYERPDKMDSIIKLKINYPKLCSSPQKEVSQKITKLLIFYYGMELYHKKVSFSLNDFSKKTGLSLHFLQARFMDMNKQNIVEHYQTSQSSTISFSTARYTANDIPISRKKISLALKKNQERTEAIVNYVGHNFRCRSQLLVEHLGEVAYKKCNRCDICIKKTIKTIDNEIYNRCKKKILYHLKEKKEISAPELLLILEQEGETRDAILEVFYELLDRKTITYTNSLLLCCGK